MLMPEYWELVRMVSRRGCRLIAYRSGARGHPCFTPLVVGLGLTTVALCTLGEVISVSLLFVYDARCGLPHSGCHLPVRDALLVNPTQHRCEFLCTGSVPVRR